MRERIRIFIATCLYYTGLLNLTLWLRSRLRRRLTILVYHRATGGDLRRQLLYLRRHYRILHLEEALSEFYILPAEGKRARDKRPLLALTFDDGYRDNYTYAFVLARELRVPFTIFLIPGYIESGKCFWWLAGERLVRNAQVEEATIGERSYVLKLAGDCSSLAQEIDTRARFATSVAKREAFLAMASQALEVSSDLADEEALRPLKWEQVKEMDESGWVSFGAHTMHHPILTCLENPEELRYEIEESHNVLEKQLGHAVPTFAYPIGLPEHFGEEGPRIAKASGFTWALTAIEEPCTGRSDPYLLERLPGDETVHWLVMAAELAGLLGVLSRLRKWDFLKRSSARA